MIPESNHYTDRLLAGDIEAIGFLDIVRTAKDVHCICSIDVDNDNIFLFHNHPHYDNVEVWDDIDNKMYTIPARTGTLEEGFEFWSLAGNNGSKLIVHNAMGYDKPLMERVAKDFPIPFEAWHDTFIQSKNQWFDRPRVKGAKSPHGLQAYGIKHGIKKPPINNFTVMTPYILHRVIEDVKIQQMCYLDLEKEKEALKDKLGIDFGGSFRIDSLYGENVAKQELDGALIDVAHYRECITELTGLVEDLTKEIEPLLPPTVKPKSSRITRSDMATLLGYKHNIVDKMVKRRRKGEIEIVPEKPYYTPSVNFHKTIKGKLYSGSNVEHGFSPEFVKKGELVAWIKENHPDTKTREWEIEVEETSYKVLDKNNCKYFNVEETATDLICGPHTKVEFIPSTMTQDEVVKGYLVRLGWKVADEWNLKLDIEKNKIKVEEATEVRWPPKAAPENQMVKIIKKGGFLVSSPTLTEDDYAQLPEGVGTKVAEYNSYQHRRRFIQNPKDPENKGLMSYIDERGRIPCGVNPFNTATGRSSQRVWVNAPSASSLYGTQIRKGLISGKGRKLAAGDQKSSQLSIAAFFAKNDTYYEAVASGSEYLEDAEGNKVLDEKTGKPTYLGESAHCASARNFGIVSHEEWMEAKRTQDGALLADLGLRRGFSKGASFGVIFGCSGAKLAGMLKVPEAEGNKRKDTFLNQMGLDKVKTFLQGCKERYPRGRGYYIPLAFGYWVYCSQDHKAINYLIQGTEAVAQKIAELQMDKLVKQAGLQDKGFKILSYHDECLWDVEDGYEHQFGAIIAKSYTWAGEALFNYYQRNPDKFPNQGGPLFKIDLSGGYDIGDNYGEVH